MTGQYYNVVVGKIMSEWIMGPMTPYKRANSLLQRDDCGGSEQQWTHTMTTENGCLYE